MSKGFSVVVKNTIMQPGWPRNQKREPIIQSSSTQTEVQRLKIADPFLWLATWGFVELATCPFNCQSH